MSEMKELKSIKIVPYTLMNSSLGAVWAFIFAIILLIFAGTLAAILPPEASAFSGLFVALGVAGLVVFPVGTFLLTITQAFLYALIYNLLVPKLGGIKIELADMKEVTKADPVAFALIVASITAVFQFLMQLVIAPLQYVSVGFIGAMATTINSLTNGTVAFPAVSMAGFGALGAILNIILTPIFTFIVAFIGAVIVAFIYNFLVPKLGGIKLELSEKAHGFMGIDSVSPVAFGLITGAVAAVIGIILGLIILILLIIFAALAGTSVAGAFIGGILILLAYAIMGFIFIFIAYALTAIFYNILAPKIGGFEIKLE
jgi:hypothetical protein